MKTKDELIVELKNDLEAFGYDKYVYTWFQFFEGYGNVLMDYALEPCGKCIDPEKIGYLLEMLEDDDCD